MPLLLDNTTPNRAMARVLPAGTRLCNGAYEVQALLGAGSFGAVYRAQDTRSGGTLALKTEPLECATPQLAIEYAVLTTALRHKEGLPEAKWVGHCAATQLKVLAMPLLGASVEALRAASAGALPLPLHVVQYVATQTLERLRACHEEHVAHRDLKPENLVFESGGVPEVAEALLRRAGAAPGAGGAAERPPRRRPPRVFLIDFGLCKVVRDPKTGAHIPLLTDKRLAGTPRFASLAAHRGLEQSRRDDLESLLYVLLFLARNRLPWEGLGAAAGASDDNFAAIADVKERLPPAELCAGLPPAFALTLEHARALAFEDMPNYTLLLRWWSVPM
jgi:serine/threonine protein kinase